VDSAELLWLALREPSDDELAGLAGALELGEKRVPLLRAPLERASVADDGQHLYVTWSLSQARRRTRPELDALSTEASGQLFAELERRVTQALDVAGDTKESIFGSFDLLVARIGQRTNDIMKVLTLGTVTLLPATVLAGVMGMNFEVGLFNYAWLYWVVIALMLAIAALVLAAARAREWI